MNKDIIIIYLNNFKSNKLNISLVQDAVDIFYNIYYLEQNNWKVKDNLNTKIAYIIRTVLSSHYNNLNLYQYFISCIYAFAKTNNFLDNFNNIYRTIDNLYFITPDYFEKYFVPFINKPYSYGIDVAFNDMFKHKKRNRFGNDFNNRLLRILIHLSKMELNINIINDFCSLAFFICISIHNIYNCNDIMDIFCSKYSISILTN